MFNLAQARQAVVGAIVTVAAAAGLLTLGSAAQAASSLNPGTAPTALPVLVSTPQIAELTFTQRSADVVVKIARPGRYTLNFRNLLAAVVDNSVDGTTLQPTVLGDYDSQYSQSFYLGAGSHAFHISDPRTQAYIIALLDGPL